MEDKTRITYFATTNKTARTKKKTIFLTFPKSQSVKLLLLCFKDEEETSVICRLLTTVCFCMVFC